MTDTRNLDTHTRATMFARFSLGLVLVSGLALGSGCASTPGTHPDDMSAEHHRHMAEMERSEAEGHDAQFDPDAEKTSGVESRTDYEFGLALYNPTAHHKRTADTHRAHADEHLAAAKALESYEDAECGSLPPESRAACPLLGPIVATEDIPNGVRLRLADDANFNAIAAHVRCHLAYARTQARKGMDHCPLYIEGVQSASTVPNALDLTVSDVAQLEALRKRAAEHVTQ